MNILPCHHDEKAVVQIAPTVELLKNLDKRYPQVLKAEKIVPTDYHGKKVFRSAVETIRGQYIASSITSRHATVHGILAALRDQAKIADFDESGTTKRYDFEVLFSREPRVASALEVKGGEGNSVNISDRPIWAVEFLVWCHLDGAITNQPSHGAAAIIFNRLTGELVKRQKRVDALLIRDALCGSPLRPCPKYKAGTDPARIAPDIFLFPQAVPSLENPSPPVHTLETLRLPKMILDLFGVAKKDYPKHLWEVHVHVFSKGVAGSQRTMRRTTVRHEGTDLEEREIHV
jgi:hypothetical protein